MIPKSEFEIRIEKIQAILKERMIDGLIVYGDEYRKENLRYVSNFWPIFERAACLIPVRGRPILAQAPEGEKYARETSVWDDIRNVQEFLCVTVPESIDYPLATISSLSDVVGDTLGGGRRLGIVGGQDVPAPIMDSLRTSISGIEIVDCDDVVGDLRLIKSEAEVACLKESGRLACIGYEQIMKTAIPGNTELAAVGAGEGAARMAGAEAIVFSVFGSGARADTIIGRPTEKVIEEGDMIMAAFAVQYGGYVATVEYPFVAGRPNDAQRQFLAVLFEAANVQQEYLKDGVVSGAMVRAVGSVFRRHHLETYDVYPPMHGIGLAEAESPYPDANSEYLLRAGMCVNSDISLFGHPAGSNRIEEGFVVGPDGPVSLTPLIRTLIEQGVQQVG